MIKQLTSEQELQQMLNLSTYAFNFKESGELQDNLLAIWRETLNWGIFSRGKLTSQVVVFPFHANYFNKSLKIAGIGYVATYPERRRQGDVRLLFSQIMEVLRDNGTILSYLAPFNRPFYRKFGYETIFNRLELTLTNQAISSLGSETITDIERVTIADCNWQEKIKELYAKTLQQTAGSIIREDWWWQSIFNDSKTKHWALRIAENGSCSGYLLYEMAETELLVHEISYLDNLTLTKFASFIGAHCATFQSIRFVGKSTEAIKHLLSDFSDVNQTLHEGMMVKIVSFDAFISQYAFCENNSISCTLAVVDPFSPWNQGVWELTVSVGKGQIRRLSAELNSDVDFYGELQSWTQLFLGKTPLKTQILLNRITATSPHKTLLLEKLIKNDELALHDSF